MYVLTPLSKAVNPCNELHINEIELVKIRAHQNKSHVVRAYLHDNVIQNKLNFLQEYLTQPL